MQYIEKGHRWFIVHTISTNTNDLKYMIEKKLQHPYVEKFVQKPFVDTDKLELLEYMYNQIQLPITIKHQHILTIMLVQIALDTHEQIPNENQDSLMNETEKQLSVLAGDYYSGLYYLLLSELEEVSMIQVLASAIRKINEHKMVVFYEDIQSTHELLHVISQIESTLFTDVALYQGIDQQVINVIQIALLLHRVEREQSIHGIIATYIKQHQTSIGKDVRLQLKEMYHLHKKQLENELMKLPYQHFSFSHALRHKFELSFNTSVAEEG